MFGLGSLIGAGIGAAANIYGSIKASKAAKKANNMLEQQKAENRNWYDQRYNEDATQRADAQRVLTMTMDRIRERNKAAAGTAAVMGGTTESVAAEKAANAQAMADAASQIAAAGEARKDAIEQQYLAKDDALTQQQIANQMQKAANIGTAAQGVAQAAMGAGAAYDEGKQSDKYLDLLGKAIK